MINCIIVEDEPLAVDKLSSFIKSVPNLNIIGVFESGLEAINFIQSNKVDLVFLDIHLDDVNSLELIENLKILPDIIITTAYDKYAIKGFDLNVVDYLLKPFSQERFISAIAKLNNTNSLTQSTTDYIFLKTEFRLEKVFLDDILYIEGMRSYRRVITKDKKIMTLESFIQLEKTLHSENFMRVHNSYIIALSKIETIERNRIFIQENIIPISEKYKKAFFDTIKTKPLRS